MITRTTIASEFPFMKNVWLECDDGWLELIYNLCKEIDGILSPWHKAHLIVTQVKEKYGGLRFYIAGGNEEVFDAIDKYESLSYNTCEICGKPGKLRDYGWMKTLCDEHYPDELRKYDRKIEE